MALQAQDTTATGSKRKRSGSGDSTGQKRKRSRSGEATETPQAEDFPAKKKSRAPKAKPAEQVDASTTIVLPTTTMTKARASNARKSKSATRNGQ